MSNTAIFLSQVSQYNLTHTIKLKFWKYFYFCQMKVGVYVFCCCCFIVLGLDDDLACFCVFVYVCFCVCVCVHFCVILGETRTEKFTAACTLFHLTEETGVSVSSIYFPTHFQHASTTTIVTATIFSVEPKDFPVHLFQESDFQANKK